jgi:protein translocase SecG subunit
MTLTILNVIYVLLAIAMIGFILVQRGAGAQAGSGFCAGASATVFGSRGAGNFLTKSTAILATLFFLLSIGTGMYVTRSGVVQTGSDLGIMEGADAPEASEVPAVRRRAERRSCGARRGDDGPGSGRGHRRVHREGLGGRSVGAHPVRDA